MEYLTKEELEKLKAFLKQKKVSQAEVARILGKEPATVGYWLKEKRFYRFRAQELIKILKERAHEGFEGLEF